MRKLHIVLIAVLVPLALGTAYVASVAEGPDFDVEFTRNIPSKLSPAYLDKVLADIPHWPSWFYSGVEANQVDIRGLPYPKVDQKLVNHATLRLGIDTKRGMSHRFDITLLVTDYEPRKKLSLLVTADSSGKITRLFSPMEWSIELIPQEGAQGGTMIRGRALGHTRTWRARVLGKFAAAVILNQIFLPNLFTLAEINIPDVVYPGMDEHGGM